MTCPHLGKKENNSFFSFFISFDINVNMSMSNLFFSLNINSLCNDSSSHFNLDLVEQEAFNNLFFKVEVQYQNPFKYLSLI